MNTLLSKTINNLRFPLCIGVVLIHSQLGSFFSIKEDNILYFLISYFFSEIVGRTAVPFFFFISGFLFYSKGVQSLKVSDYINNLFKRMKSLLIPYLLWNIVIILIYQFLYLLIPQFFSGEARTIFQYSLGDWLHVFGFGSHPADAPLWFIRDLMMVSIISPILWFLFRRSLLLLLIGIICWLLGYDSGITGFSVTAIVFFALGIYGNYKQDKLIRFLLHNNLMINILFILLSIINMYLRYIHQERIDIYNLCILVGCAAIFSFCIHLTQRNILNTTPFLLSSCFFVFAFHYLPIIFMQKFIYSFLHPESDMALVLIYFMCPILILAISLFLFYILKKSFPKGILFFVGGR